jgi:hypothetical protein
MAITVGFIKAIGVVTDDVFTPDIIATLEGDFNMRGILEKGLTIISWLEEKFNIIGKAKK